VTYSGRLLKDFTRGAVEVYAKVVAKLGYPATYGVQFYTLEGLVELCCINVVGDRPSYFFHHIGALFH